MLENEKLNQLKGRLGIELTDTTKDEDLLFALQDVEETIKDHCHITEIPDGLNTTVIRMARELYMNENLGSDTVALGSVSSISEGDTSTSFRSAASEFKDSLLKDYKSRLNKYRKLVW
jgi:phosphoenolpyruvate synthase/pyruvate phosphate dikinase